MQGTVRQGFFARRRKPVACADRFPDCGSVRSWRSSCSPPSRPCARGTGATARTPARSRRRARLVRRHARRRQAHDALPFPLVPTLMLLWPVLAAPTASGYSSRSRRRDGRLRPAAGRDRAVRPRPRPARPRPADRIGAVALVYPPLVAVGVRRVPRPRAAAGARARLVAGAPTTRWTWVAACPLLLAGLREDVCLELAIVGPVGRLNNRADAATAPKPRAALGFKRRSAVVSARDLRLLVIPRVGPGRPRTSTTIRSRTARRRCWSRRCCTRSRSARRS